MTSNDPNARPGGWPQNPSGGQHPQQPDPAQRPPAASPDDPGFHEQNTLEAAQFKRPEQPTPPPPHGPPTGAPGGWPAQQPPPQWPNQPSAAGYPPNPAPGGHGFPQPPGQPPQQPPGGKSPDPKTRALIGGAVAAVALLVAVAIINFSGADDEGDDASTNTAATSSVKMTPAGPRTPSGEPSEPGSPKQSPEETPAPPPPPPPPPVVAPDALAGFLLPAEQISQLMGSPGMTLAVTDTTMIAGNITPPNCTGAWGPVHAATYDGTGFTGMTAQAINNDPTHKVVEAVVSFPDAPAAQAFYDRQVAEWNACKLAKITAQYGDAKANGATLGVPSTAGGILSLAVVAETSNVANMQCERAMAVRGNVIVDVRACSPSVGSAGWNIARDIGNKIIPAP